MPRRGATPSAAPEPPTPLAVSRLTDVVGQMRLINGIFAALNSSIEIDDLHLMLLTILTSPRGLGFTRAYLFLPGGEPRRFEGRLGLGCESEEELSALEEEIRGEEQLLASMASRRSTGKTRRAELNDLRSQSWWITAFQRASASNALTAAILNRQLFKRGLHRAPRLLAEDGDIHTLHVQAKSPPTHLEPQTVRRLGREFLLAPLRTKRGVRAIVAADKSFRVAGITPDDTANFEWLCNQTSLALQNAELFADLRQAYSEIQEVDRMKSNFLSTISHELRTPLTSILGFAQLILSGRTGEVNPEITRLLEKVVGKSRDLQRMVNDLLEIAEIQAGGLVRLEQEPIGLEAILTRVIDRVAERRERESVQIEHRHPEGPLPPVLGDERALERVFYHLIDNAVKFSQDNGHVSVGYRKTAQRVEVTVRDDGIGIAPQNLERIFDHFYQVDSELNRHHSGIGLGLTITKKLLGQLNGDIEVKSRPGKGSLFRVSFPVVTAESS
ncbi:HAMP domain-containing histidine kinase [Candidatus Sumerlaeota bacterium]|nr:HAMP domain-containing histidine kinase [Candidatus Sumerlaeota bacterium]